MINPIVNNINLNIGDILISGIEKYRIVTIRDDGSIIVSPVSDKIVYMDTWEEMSSLYSDPIKAITEWYFESRKRMKYPSPYSRNRKRNSDEEYKQIRLLIEKDGYSLEEVLTLLSFAISDTFWGRTGLQSLTSIRKPNENGQRKIESIKGGYLRKIQREENMKKYGKNNG